MILAGIDEAALGPVLGPFCACCVSLYSETKKEFPSPVQDRASGLYFTDSKKVYCKAKGIKTLEQNVLAALLCLNGRVPETAGELISLIAPVYSGWKSMEWYEGFNDIKIPRKADPDRIKRLSGLLQKHLENEGFRLNGIKALAVSAAEFNESLDLTGNKSDTVRDLIKALFPELIETPLEIITDCQGGRRYYSEWLDKVYPGKLFSETINEGASIYNSENLMISFEIKADANYLPVAMASMTAKYLRELFMEQFNLYWIKKIPGLASTAGYPQDGKRFIADLSQHGLLPENRDVLVRKK